MQYHIYIVCQLVVMCLSAPLVKCDSHGDGEYDVIILGAGMAGVSAARTLVNEGITNFVILEGRDEVGGRMHTKTFGDFIVEGGAQWIHLTQGNTQNPLFIEALKYNVSGFETDYDDLLFYDEEGNDVTEEGMREFEHLDVAFDEMHAYGEKLWANQYRDDISVKGSLRWFGFNPKTPVQMACDYYYTEFEAAEYASVLSNRYIVASSLHPDYGEQDVLVIDPRGYAVIPRMILSNEVPDWEDKLHLETVVTALNYTDSMVVVTTDKGTFTGKKVIVTFSIGVLQNSLVQFYPSLPEWKLQSLHAFSMNDYIHIHVRFNPNIIWFVPHDTEWIIYASKRRGYFTIWQNVNKAKPESHMLQVAVSGAEARRLQASTNEEVKVEVMAVLKNMFGHDVPEAEEILIPRFNSDPFFQGSYSDWPVGFTRSQHKALQAPVGSVYFAGEAYSLHQYGYAHGALVSGEDVAKDVAACVKDSNACAKPYVPPYAATGCTYRFSLNYDPNAQIDDGSCMMTVQAPTSGGWIIHQESIIATVMVSLLVLKW